ncbi:MAG TPA: DUF4286 family protein [Bacteroidia bacterium]|nr:DUF4286 family protein [Bacteroidia bacterium]HNT79289.1 DUF4286 family protein [Bacteroidia bacterium]
MIVYNVTINIDESIHHDWLEWMQKHHIPDVMRTGMFIKNSMFKVVSEEEQNGHTYSIQYTCKSNEMLRSYQETFAPALQAEHTERYKNRFVAFRSVLELLAETEMDSI